jgi:hypothetical protein
VLLYAFFAQDGTRKFLQDCTLDPFFLALGPKWLCRSGLVGGLGIALEGFRSHQWHGMGGSGFSSFCLVGGADLAMRSWDGFLFLARGRVGGGIFLEGGEKQVCCVEVGTVLQSTITRETDFLGVMRMLSKKSLVKNGTVLYLYKAQIDSQNHIFSYSSSYAVGGWVGAVSDPIGTPVFCCRVVQCAHDTGAHETVSFARTTLALGLVRRVAAI